MISNYVAHVVVLLSKQKKTLAGIAQTALGSPVTVLIRTQLVPVWKKA
jgi:hypothetical protein